VVTGSSFIGEPQRLQVRTCNAVTLASNCSQLHGAPWKTERDSLEPTVGQACGSRASWRGGADCCACGNSRAGNSRTLVLKHALSPERYSAPADA
jgi:hypothetical protein